MIRVEKIGFQDGIGIYNIELDDGDNIIVNDGELAQLKTIIDNRIKDNDRELISNYIEILINEYNKSEVSLVATQKELDELIKHPQLKSVHVMYKGYKLVFADGRKIKVECTDGVELR